MKPLNLFDEQGNLYTDARAILKLYQVYPNCTASREQAMLILSHEKQRRERLRSETYRVTDLIQAIITNLHNADGQWATAGYVAMAMYAMHRAGLKPSLKRASAIVERFSRDDDKVEFKLWTRDKLVDREKSVPSDIKTIKSHFWKYRPAAHLIAAEMMCSFVNEPKFLLDWTPDENAQFVATALYFQRELSVVQNFESWNLHRISEPPETAKFEVDAIVPSNQFLCDFIGDWAAENNVFPDCD